MKINYELLKNYESPAGSICSGVVKTEKEWIERFRCLREGDCENKTDWFKKVETKEPEYKLGISFFTNGIETYYKEYDFKELING